MPRPGLFFLHIIAASQGGGCLKQPFLYLIDNRKLFKFTIVNYFMRFRNFPELVLGSKTKLRVLLHLLAEPSMPTSEREVAKLIGTSHTAVNKVMKDFYDAHLVTPMKVGNVNAWKLNEKSYAYGAISDLKMMATAPPIKRLKDDIMRYLGARPNIKRVVIFGSIAEGTESPASDIDLLLVVDVDTEETQLQLKEPLMKLGEVCINFYGNNLSPRIATIKDVESSEHKKSPFSKILQKGIVVI